MEDGGGKNGFDGVPDAVTKVNEVAETGLAFVDGDDVRLYRDRADDDREQQFL